MFRETILAIFLTIWPTILICIITIGFLRYSYLKKNDQPLIIHKELMNLLLVIYLMSLFYVVTFQDVSFSNSNFIPFKEMFRYQFGTRLFLRNVVGNMVLFLPYGYAIAYYLKIKRLELLLFFSLLASLLIETIQLLIGRVFDIDDIILNVIGGIIGGLLFIILNRIKDKLPSSLKNELVYNIIVISLIVVVILYLSRIINVG